MRRSSVVIVAAGLVLSACGQGGSDPAAKSDAAPPAAAEGETAAWLGTYNRNAAPTGTLEITDQGGGVLRASFVVAGCPLLAEGVVKEGRLDATVIAAVADPPGHVALTLKPDGVVVDDGGSAAKECFADSDLDGVYTR